MKKKTLLPVCNGYFPVPTFLYISPCQSPGIVFVCQGAGTGWDSSYTRCTHLSTNSHGLSSLGAETMQQTFMYICLGTNTVMILCLSLVHRYDILLYFWSCIGKKVNSPWIIWPPDLWYQNWPHIMWSCAFWFCNCKKKINHFYGHN